MRPSTPLCTNFSHHLVAGLFSCSNSMPPSQGRQKENGSGGAENLHAQTCAENVHLPRPLLIAHALKTQFVIHTRVDLSWMLSYSYNSTLAMPDTVHHWYGDLWFARVSGVGWRPYTTFILEKWWGSALVSEECWGYSPTSPTFCAALASSRNFL